MSFGYVSYIMRSISCTNTHHDVTDLVNHGMVKNTITWIPGEWNITFTWNKKILNLCLRCLILRSCRFVTEVTFKQILFYHIKETQTLFKLFWVRFEYDCLNLIFYCSWSKVRSSKCMTMVKKGTWSITTRYDICYQLFQ